VLQRVQHVSLIGQAVSERSVSPVIESVWTTARLFHERGDAIPRHNVPDRPMLDPITGVLFLAGLALAWRSRWQRVAVFMVVWLAAVLLFGGVLTDGAQALRIPSALVPLCYFAALGAQSATRLVKGLSLVAALCVLIALVGMAASLRYFVEYAGSSKVARSFSPRAYVAGVYLRAAPPGVTVIVAPGIDRSVVQFVAGRDEAHVLRQRPRAMVPRADAVYVFDNEGQIPAWAKSPDYAVAAVGGPEWWQTAFVVRQVPKP
jgi:hypothetical protein